MKKPKPSKGERVWVAVYEGRDLLLLNRRRKLLVMELDREWMNWRNEGITIERYRLIPDPLPRRKK